VSSLRDRPAPSSAAGFSLIEILLVLGIIGLLGGIALVDYSGLLTFERLKQTGRKIGGYCERARAQALSLQRSCLLELDFVHSRYRFVPDPARDEFGRFVNPDTDVTMSVDDLAEWNEGFEWEDLPRDVFFSDVQVSALEKFDERHGTVRIRYPPDGTVDPFIVHLKTGAGDTFSVAVNGLTGAADCEPGWAEFPVAEASNFNQVMGDRAPGAGSSRNKGKEEEGGGGSGGGPGGGRGGGKGGSDRKDSKDERRGKTK
jgi:prepilin-type N-terminal cleavage/methylation domain-containing protein